MDYKKLLIAFMRVVDNEEGCLFFASLERNQEKLGITDEEIEELKKIADELPRDLQWSL